jgi:LmbE family N-acetylglucosaminyl deacetylase
MSLFDFQRGEKWHLAMTHPDDEISIAAFAKRLCEGGAEVSMSWTHSNPVREQEAYSAAAKIGVPRERCFVFGAPDGNVVDHLLPLSDRLSEMFATIRPDRVVCGAFEQGHLDHDATNFLVNRCFEGTVLEVPFYHAYLRSYMRINRFADPAGQEVIELSPDEVEWKKALAKGYPSQRIWWNLWWYEAWEVLRFRRPELARTERMRIQVHRDFRSPNLPPDLAERVKRSPKWRRWIAALDAFDR